MNPRIGGAQRSSELRGSVCRPARRWRGLRWVGLCACVVLLILYVRSLFHPGVGLYGPYGYLGVADGVVALRWWPIWPPHSRMPWQTGHFSFHIQKLRWWFELGGFYTGSGLVVPLWALLAPAMVATALCWRHARPTPGQCRTCGYDLTGNTSGRCPECGERLTNGPAA